MRVRDLLAAKNARLITVGPKTELGEVSELLIQHNIGGVPVVSAAGEVLGFLSERDIVRAIVRHHGYVVHLRAEDAMQPPPVCDADDSLDEVMHRMTGHRHRHLVVQYKGAIAGVISVGDLVHQRADQLQTEAGVLRDYLAGQRGQLGTYHS